MTGRPPELYPLFAELETLEGVGPKIALNFKGLEVFKPRDLLFTLPYSGVDRRRRSTILGIDLPSVVTVEVEIGRHIPPSRKGRPYRVEVRDAEMTFQLVFFHARDDWLNRQLPTGQRRVVSGKVELFDGIGQMPHPDHMLRVSEASEIPEFEPVYPLTAGVTQKTMAKAIGSTLQRVPDLGEWIDEPLMDKEDWPDWKTAVQLAHQPTKIDDVSSTNTARQRLAYDELFAHQLTLSLARASYRRAKGRPTEGNGGASKQSVVGAALPADWSANPCD